MDGKWSFSREIYDATHNWTSIILYGLLGVLIGWAASFVWPSPYRATQEVYVGLNVYQLEGDEYLAGFTNLKFTNADDFKNWQMANLNSLVFMENVLDDALARLRATDPYWNAVSRTAFARMLQVYWRNAGKWRLTADHKQPFRATQAVIAWQETAVDHIHAAIDQAQQAMILDLQLRSNIDYHTQALVRKAALEQTIAALLNWRTQTSSWPADQPIDPLERERIAYIITQAELGTGREDLMTGFPAPSAPAAKYAAWLELALSALDQDLQNINAQITTLVTLNQDLAVRYAESTRQSLGLSSNLIVDRTNEDTLELVALRPTGLLVSVGGLLGLIIWTLMWSAKITTLKESTQPV